MSAGDYEVGTSLDCPVCLEPYDDQDRCPKMMSCLHTTCLACILNMINSQNTAGKTTLQPIPAVLPTPVRAPAPTQRQPTSTATEHQTQAQRILAELMLSLTSRSTNGNSGGTSRVQPPRVPPRTSIISRTPVRTAPTRPEASTVFRQNPTQANASARLNSKELPKGVTFSCPMCRTKISSNSVQTNRYIIAHIEDINKLQRAAAKRNSTTPSTPRPVASSTPQPSVLNAAVEESDHITESWCVACDAFGDVNKCINHKVVPLEEWNRIKSKKLAKDATQMQKNVEIQRENIQGLEAELRALQNTTRALLGKVESQNKEWNRIKVVLDKLKHDCKRNCGGPLTGPSARDDVKSTRRESALKLQELTQLLQSIQNEATKVESKSLSGNCVVWTCNNKLYMKNSTTTFTVVKEDSNYVM